MLNELQTLKKLIEKGDYDEESHKLVADYEKKYSDIVRLKKLAEKDGFRQWLELMRVEIEFADRQLAEKEDLTDNQRKDLFATKRVCRKFIELLTGDEEGLKNEINGYIERNSEELADYR